MNKYKPNKRIASANPSRWNANSISMYGWNKHTKKIKESLLESLIFSRAAIKTIKIEDNDR